MYIYYVMSSDASKMFNGEIKDGECKKMKISSYAAIFGITYFHFDDEDDAMEFVDDVKESLKGTEHEHHDDIKNNDGVVSMSSFFLYYMMITVGEM